MRTHETIVGWLHVAAGAFAFGCVALLWLAAAALAQLFAGTFIPGLVALFGRPIAIVLLAASGLEIVAAIALLQRQAWPRPVLMTIGALQLVAFPIGTALGAYTFWALLHTPNAAAAPGTSA